MIRRKLVLVAAVLAGALSGASPAPRAIHHGRDLGPADVGPAAIGVTPGPTVSGGIISDAERPSYVRSIGTEANYGGVRITGPHLLIEGVVISGPLDISAQTPVVLFGVEMRPAERGPWLVLVRPDAGPLHVLWSDLSVARKGQAVPPRIGVALALRADGSRVHRSRIGAAADGIQIGARDVGVTETLIDALVSRAGDHNDAIQLFDTASDVEIARSRIANRHPQTSAVTILGKDVSIRDNWLAGGGWTLYGGAAGNGNGGHDAPGVRVIGNVFARSFFPRSGSFGPVAYWSRDASAGNQWSGNTYDDGAPVDPVGPGP